MLSEFLMMNTPIQDAGRSELSLRGYPTSARMTFMGPTVTVEHLVAELGSVEALVQSVDPAAHRCCTDGRPASGLLRRHHQYGRYGATA